MVAVFLFLILAYEKTGSRPKIQDTPSVRPRWCYWLHFLSSFGLREFSTAGSAGDLTCSMLAPMELLRLRPGLAGAAQLLPVFFGLVGIEAAELAQRLGKAVAGAEIAGDDQRVAGAGVAAGQQLAADLGVRLKAAAGHILEVDGALVIVELAHQELASADVRPAQEWVGLQLHGTLPFGGALAVVVVRVRIGQPGRVG